MTRLNTTFTDQHGELFESLPDLISGHLNLISIGLNPGFRSIKAGFYFANPRNRFWRCLSTSGLSKRSYQPSLQANIDLFETHGIGFTDVVKRPTAGSSDLRVSDYKYWAPILRQHLMELQPKLAWFHGKVAFRNYLRVVGEASQDVDWGLQELMEGQTRFYVSPNPSPANAAFSNSEITESYRRLAELIG
jgi:TDG/mug DNA glycosylase family protein